MKPLLSFATCLAACVASAQGQEAAPVRIPIRHADPWFVKAMMEGEQLRFPEISTIMAISGMGPGGMQAGRQAGNALFSGGKLVVNPTDNSLWFFPDKK